VNKLSFLLLIFASSCLDSTKILPSSTGSFSEVIFVVEDVLWQESIKEVVTETFGAPIQGLNQDEASFRIVQVNHTEFKSILKTHKNIVIIAKDVKASSQKNKWANVQLVVQLNYEKNNIKNNLNKIKAIFELEEVRSIKNKITTTSQQLHQKNIYQNFKIELLIPSEYTIIKDTSTFFWATYNPEKQEVIKHLLVFSFIPKATSLQQEVLQKTDSIFAQYLHGAKQGQYVKIEPEFPPYYINNAYSGLWKLEKGFMGGPFLAKTYFVNEKIVVVVGLVFDPNSRKRKHLKTFEAIL
jgi:hypothetical protein